MDRAKKAPSRFRRRVKKADALGCVLLVYLFPVLTGAVFFRVLAMGGAPGWWLIANGALFLAALGQAVYFVVAGVVPALRKALGRGAKGGTDR